ncbi:MAG TPA: GNAT family N-acetyltransferase [Candidatus Hydrogenedentes bacterium]|nr:GNAT family N-acetyltransferase [Candidatus Hydrogenedentota bacterium]
MSLTLREVGPEMYATYAEIDPSYEVTSVLSVVPKARGLGGLMLVEEPIAEPYTNGVDEPQDSPAPWPPTHETGEFGVFLAMDGERALGGAAVIINPVGAFLFERRDTLAGLWDIRVRRECRRTGIGSRLLLHAADWAKEKGCTQLRVECQNVNPVGCRFYAKHCVLGGVERYGYAACPDVAHEVMLLWYRDL